MGVNSTSPQSRAFGLLMVKFLKKVGCLDLTDNYSKNRARSDENVNIWRAFACVPRESLYARMSGAINAWKIAKHLVDLGGVC